jgi:hypothetical protein
MGASRAGTHARRLVFYRKRRTEVPPPPAIGPTGPCDLPRSCAHGPLRAPEPASHMVARGGRVPCGDGGAERYLPLDFRGRVLRALAASGFLIAATPPSVYIVHYYCRYEVADTSFAGHVRHRHHPHHHQHTHTYSLSLPLSHTTPPIGAGASALSNRRPVLPSSHRLLYLATPVSPASVTCTLRLGLHPVEGHSIPWCLLAAHISVIPSNHPATSSRAESERG